MDEIAKGARVRLHFSLALQNDGKDNVIDSTFDDKPVEFTVGDGNLPENFESCLLGMKKGEEKTCTLEPERAFGLSNPGNIHVMSKERFKNLNLTEGLVISFADAGGHERPGVIKSMGERTVTIDFNHPLAGRTIHFRAHILEIFRDSPT